MTSFPEPIGNQKRMFTQLPRSQIAGSSIPHNISICSIPQCLPTERGPGLSSCTFAGNCFWVGALLTSQLWKSQQQQKRKQFQQQWLREWMGVWKWERERENVMKMEWLERAWGFASISWQLFKSIVRKYVYYFINNVVSPLNKLAGPGYLLVNSACHLVRSGSWSPLRDWMHPALHPHIHPLETYPEGDPQTLHL